MRTTKEQRDALTIEDSDLLLDELDTINDSFADLADAVKLLERSRSALQFFGENCENDLLRQKAYREVKDIDDFLAEPKEESR